jgi:hypothetical protein
MNNSEIMQTVEFLRVRVILDEFAEFVAELVDYMYRIRLMRF